MTTTPEKRLEAQARRLARRAGYIARKSNWRRDSIDNFGGFMLVDVETGGAIAGSRFDLTAEAVIEWCREEIAEQAT